MSLAINPVFPVIAAQGPATDAVLQPGTTVDARVLKLLDANLVRIAIANLTIEVLSEVPLQPGTDVRLAVSQTAQGVRLQVVPQGAGSMPSTPAPVADPSPVDTVSVPQAAANAAAGRGLTNLEALAVSAAVQNAAARQGSLSPLFANLGVAAASAVLPQTLQQAAAQLLARRSSLDQTLTGENLKAAFKASGLFMEQAFASASSQAPAVADLKAALIVFRQALSTWLAEAPAPEPPPSLPSSAAPSLAPAGSPAPEVEEILLPQASVLVAKDIAEPDGKMRLYAPHEPLPAGAGRVSADLAQLQDILQAFPKGVRDAVADLLAADARMAGAGAVADDDGVALSNVPPPPFRGSAPSAQPVAAPSVMSEDTPAAIVHRLIEDTDAALARQTLLQAASLPERADAPGARIDPNAPRWHFEIPFATAQGTAVAQFEIARDGSGTEVAAAQRVWRARFSLDVEPNGPVHALVTLSGGRTSVRMWAERPVTAARLRADAPQLAHALREAALEPGDIVIGDGAPPRAAAPAAGHFLDRAL
jgi:hypothetical protein